MNSNIRIKWFKNQEEEKKFCNLIRDKVFIEEQKFSTDLDEFDSLEDFTTLNLLVYYDEIPVGTARILFKEDKKHWYIGRICILMEYRGKKLGNFIMETTMEKCKELKIDEVYLGAQVRVKEFHKKHGFKEFGEIYYDEYCEHIDMVKKI